MPFVRIAMLHDVPEGEAISAEAGALKICLVKAEGEIYAFRDRCTHRDFPLSEGEVDVEECSITCEWHGAKFHMKTGAVLTPPAVRPVAVYEVRIEGDEIWVDV